MSSESPFRRSLTASLLATALVASAGRSAWAQSPKTDEPKVVAPGPDEPKPEPPKPDVPKPDAPKGDDGKKDGAKKDDARGNDAKKDDARGDDAKKDDAKKDDGKGEREKSAVSKLPPDTRVPSPKRALPDYDGRGAPPTTAGDVAIWIPRGLLFPFWLVTEYLVRKPLGFAVSTADIKHWPVKAIEFFTFGPDNDAALFPTAFFDFGMNPSVGIYGYVDKLFHRNNKLTYNAGFWGPSWLSFGVRDRVTVGRDSWVSLGASWNRRPDQPFYGLGPRSRHANESRYGLSMFEAPLKGDLRLGRGFRLLTTVGLRIARFHEGYCCSDPDAGARIAAGQFAAPPGYPQGYDALYNRLELIADSRSRRPAKQTGVRGDAYVEQGMDPRPAAGASWLKWGGSAGLYLDVGHTRTIGLKGSALFTESFSGEVPFLEQASLGGFGLMRGYLQNRLIDRSALVTELEYRWPVWVFLDGTLQASVGNVFGPHLKGLDADLMRLSAAVGVRSNNSADHQLEVLVGAGTETFEEGLPITSVRIFVGGTNGV